MQAGQVARVLTSHSPPSNINAAYAGSVKFGVGSGIAAGLDLALTAFQMYIEASLRTSVAQKYLLQRARARTHFVEGM